MIHSLRSIRYFVVVAEELHFGVAAKRLNITQPPLSQSIRQLEHSLGTELFSRSTRSVQLTVAGEVLLIQVKQLLIDLDSAEKAVLLASKGVAGRLILGFPHSSTYLLLPKLISLFKEKYTSVVLDLKEMVSNDLVNALRSRKIDIALIRATFPKHENDLRFLNVLNEKMLLVLPHSHPLAIYDKVPIKSLAGLPFIGYLKEESNYFHDILNNIFHSRKIKLNIQYESVLPTLLALVEAGLGIGLVPASVYGMRPGRLTYKPLTGSGFPITAQLNCAWKLSNVNPTVKNFLDLISELKSINEFSTFKYHFNSAPSLKS